MMTEGAKKLTEKQVERVEKLLKGGYSIEGVVYKTGLGQTVIRTISKGNHIIQRRRAEKKEACAISQEKSQPEGLMAKCSLEDLNKLIETLETAVGLMNGFKVKGVKNGK